MAWSVVGTAGVLAVARRATPKLRVATKYSPQELRSAFHWLRHAEFREQFGFRVRPLNRLRMPIELIKVVLELLLQGQRTRKIIRGEDVPLHLAEDDLDLIEPTRMCRQPVNPHFKGQLERRNPGAELFRGMRGAVIENQMDDLQARTQGALEQLQQEGLAIGKLSPAAGLCKRQPRRDDQGTEQLHGAHPFIPIGDVEGISWRRGLSDTHPLTGLDRGLLITAHHRFA